MLSIVEADEHAVADDKRWHPRWPGTSGAGQGNQPVPCCSVGIDRMQPNVESGSFSLQLGQESFGIGAMWATFADEYLDRLERPVRICADIRATLGLKR